MARKLFSRPISRDNRLSDMVGLLSLKTLVASVLLIVIVYAFFSGIFTQFYASALFLFYALTQKMWVSVILLGVFQTLIMIPFRILRVRRSQNIQEFQEETTKLSHSVLQQKKLKQQFSFGNATFLFYLVDFMIQLATFLTIGRLFLKDFYSIPLNPDWLYSFVPYPTYPIQDRFFQIPYVSVTQTHNFGLWGVIIFLALFSVGMLSLELFRRWRVLHQVQSATRQSKLPAKYFVVYAIFVIGISWVLAHNFPTMIELRIFSGDVSIPNRQLNAVTAITTFLTMLWFGYKRIQRVSNLALEKGLTVAHVEKTEKKLFAESIKNSTLVGLGAYFITNHIPSAFELSIFTFEVIALASPLTLDKIALKLSKKKAPIDDVEVVVQPAETSKIS